MIIRTVIETNVIWVIEGEISTGNASVSDTEIFGVGDFTYKYLSTSANQKLSVSLIFIVAGLLTS
jgi:hypothetical protein